MNKAAEIKVYIYPWTVLIAKTAWCAPPSTTKCIMTKPIIRFSFLLVRKHLISFVYFFELLFRISTFIHVRMMRSCFFPVGTFYLSVTGCFGDTKYFVIVSLRRHNEGNFSRYFKYLLIEET